MPSTLKAIDAFPSTAAASALASLTTTYRYNNTVLLPSLEERLQTLPPPPSPASLTTLTTYSISPAATANEINSSTGLTSISHVASVVVSNFLPLSTTSLFSGNAGNNDDSTSSGVDTKVTFSTSTTSSTSVSPLSTLSTASSAVSVPVSSSTATATFYPSYSPPVVESLVASSAEEFSNNFRDLSFDIFDDNDNDLFGSPLAFDASENGLWNGRFVPPPPRPPFFVDEPVLSDGLTTCDLCSWAMPTKSTFIFEGTMEKASELGWPLTLTIVSILSAVFGAIIMIAVVKCRRKKTSHQRSDTHVQWWSRNKRPNGNNNHLRRSNIYTAHPADSIRGLQQPNSLSASSSMTAMTTAMAAPSNATNIAVSASSTLPYYHHSQQQQQQQLHHVLGNQQYLQQFEHEHEYHQPQELQLQLQPQQQQTSHSNHHHTQHLHAHSHAHHQNPHAHLHHHHHHEQLQQQQQHGVAAQHQHQHSASMSSSSTNSMPSLSTQPLQMQIPEQQIHLQSLSSSSSGGHQPQKHVHKQHKNNHHRHKQHQEHLQHNQHQQQHEQDLDLEQPSSLLSSSSDLHDNNMFHWPTATSIVTS